MNNPAIVVDDITVDYNGFIALSNAHLVVPSGTICALVGMNGAGKSTLFKAIMGFLTPAAGRVLIDGGPVAAAQKAGRLAYMPQAEEVDWAFPVNVQDVVMMGRYGFMNILRTPRKLDKQKVAESIERVGMQDFRTRQISELSGGQRKRAFLARALAQDARIMLLDEPFTGIDAKTEEAMIGLLRELRDEGCTVIICTHDLASGGSFGAQVALINRTVLGYGPLETTCTPANIAGAYGGVFNHLIFNSDAGKVIAREAHLGRTQHEQPSLPPAGRS
ncbi:MAG: metal ABC transporter ATP-binding protein [Roseiflexaceae bacterium]|nr:metal ABC transporter ATP-binding protein [Roseiflexaceae bacterium]